MTKAIILDYDGVIRFPNEVKEAAILQKRGFEPEEFFSMLWDNSPVSDLVTGKIDRQTWWSKVQELHPKLRTIEASFLWEEVFAHPKINTDLLDLMQEFKEENQVKLAILSNADAPSKKVIQQQMQSYDFDVILTSSDTGIAKPEPQIYHHILELLDTNPGQTVFVDDSQKNVAAAQELGLHAFLYQNIDKDELILQPLKNH